MSDEKEHNRHEQAAYEAAIRLKREREVREDMARYKKDLQEQLYRYERNLQPTLPYDTAIPSDDFEGCVE